MIIAYWLGDRIFQQSSFGSAIAWHGFVIIVEGRRSLEKDNAARRLF
ncbi:hypothetical protein [Spirulina sp. 06S082]|nr:hypothetical protein [Spirulina sp. 06S082]MEA5472526.1 hypothetical protein [Spirulina sp. 06S082]